jgi:acetylornithine deacetylase/succinyl-diaminopimelate desuccinylase-like protein
MEFLTCEEVLMARVTQVSPTSLASAVDALMPQLTADLVALTRIPSISEATFPAQPVHDACQLVMQLLRDAGLQDVKTLDLPETYPIVIGAIPAPSGAPTVLLYGHYDVVPPGDESKWTSPPFEPATRDGAIFGRGASDSKANVIAHVGALRTWGGKPPVGIKVIVEGMEEVGSALNQYPLVAPEQFRSDAMLITDMGSLRPGAPTLTVALRGTAVVHVEVNTLAGPKHSGQFGGAAPDALIVLLHALASLHDMQGNVAVAGLRREPWKGEAYSEAEFRELAEVRKDLPLFGTGGLGERLWSGPAITITGLDALPVDKAVNAVVPHARAKINLRVHPQQDAKEAQEALIAHLTAVRPFGISLTVTPGATGDGFAAGTSGPAYDAARAALATAWGGDTITVATGGSIPLVHALNTGVPDAEILLLGATDGFSNIHAPNERVLVKELRNTVLAQALFFHEFADRWSRRSPH